MKPIFDNCKNKQQVMRDKRLAKLGRGGGLYLKPRDDSCTKGARVSDKFLGSIRPSIEARGGGLDLLHTMSKIHQMAMDRIESKDRKAGTGQEQRRNMTSTLADNEAATGPNHTFPGRAC